MKATIYYNKTGEIQSVVFLAENNQTSPQSAHHESIEVDVDEITPASIGDLHFKHSVDIKAKKLIRH